jgi:predicted GNAT family acetyltransferase
VAITNDEAAGRFKMQVDGQTAFLQYRRRGDSIVFIHTEVPPTIAGHGIGSQLARAGLDYARDSGLQVTPLCPFVTAYIRAHPEYLNLVKPEYRKRLSGA